MKTLPIAVFASLLAAPAAAEPPADGEVTRYAFEDTLVGGDGYQPGIEVLSVRGKGHGDSLVRIRETFVPELLNSVEQLQGL